MVETPGPGSALPAGLDLTPLDRYEPSRAKACASVRWLLQRAHDGGGGGGAESVPEDELQDHLYTDESGQEHIRAAVSRLLLSPQVYCRAAWGIKGTPGGHGGAPEDTQALLQLLVKRGHTVRTDEGEVTEKELSQEPIRMKAHLALIDALMTLAAQNTVDQVKMAAEAQQMGSGSPWENAMLFWVNRINQKLRESTEEEEGVPRAPNCTDVQPPQDPSQSSRWYWKLVPIRYRKDKVQSKLTPTFPLVSELKDLSNGCAIGATLHYYCPGLLPLEEVCLKDTMSVADSVYNLQLIKAFSETHLQRCCPLQVEDLLYAPTLLHINILVFLSELLDCFEVQRPDFVKPVQPIDLTDVSGVLDCTSPVSGHTHSGSPSYIFKQPFVPMSPEVSAENQSWAKKQISRPLSAVAFSIPFGLDSDVDIVMGNPIDCVFRPVSTDSLAPAIPAMTSPVSAFSPPEDLSHLISSSAPVPRSWGPYLAPLGELPTIEEARQVSHLKKSRPEPRLRPEGAPAGFYLHSPEEDSPRLSSSVPSRAAEGDRRRGRSSDMSRDDDSVLRDGSVDSSEASDDTPKNTPGNIRPNWGRQNHHSPNGSPRMTSFAERRDSRRRQPAAPGEDASSVPTTPGSPALGSGRLVIPGTPGPEALALGARLEEKRKSIEAQKRRIEAIFAKHRQRLGKTAFLQLQREQGEGGGDTEGDAVANSEGHSGGSAASNSQGDSGDQLSLDERLTQVEEQLQREEEREKTQKDTVAPPRLEKQVTFSLDSKDRGGGSGSSGPAPRLAPGPAPGVQEYTEVVQKLNEALQCLQKDMQKLTQQQQQLLSGQWPRATQKNSPKNKAPLKANKTPPHTPTKATSHPLTKASTRSVSKAWVIPAAASVSRRSSGSPQTALSSSCPAPRTRNSAPRSPKAPPRPHVAHPRPSELKFPPPLTRVLTPPQNVDSLPHLRRVSPSKCQVQTSSSFRIGGPKTPQESPQSAQPEEGTSDTGSSETPTQFSLELDQEDRSSTREVQQPAGGSSPSECSLQSETMSLSAFSGGPEGDRAGDRSSLMASLSSLGPAEGGSEEQTDETHEFSSDSMSDHTEGAVAGGRPEQECAPPPSESSAEGPPEALSSETSGEHSDSGLRGAIGFFFTEGPRCQEEMAQRKAVLLERQQRRSEELRRRRQWHEQDPDRLTSLEQREPSPSEAPPTLPSASPTHSAASFRRGDFTRVEYARRQQLRIMDDLDKMMKQKPTLTGKASGKKTRARPRSMTRESTHLSLSPAKTTSGPMTKVYSHSSLNLAVTDDTGEAKKPQSRPGSPSRPDKEWDSGSSGTSSAPEYTGPKLFKEPSLKSNKFIIHNALSRCCLAGKVNEAQKKRIVEEMEKSAANHFLILFRDQSCQFRGVYTLSQDGQELARLTGVGPRSLSCSQVESIYKYSSDRKQFSPIPSKTLGMSVDAFTIPGPLWQGGSGGAGSGANRRASVTKKSSTSAKKNPES